MEKTYWGHQGKYQKEYDAFRKNYIPNEGQAHGVKAEALRLAGNLYYDFHNNGLCNVFLGGRRLDFQLLEAVMTFNGLADSQLKNLFDRIEERDKACMSPFGRMKDSMPISKQNSSAFEHLINKIMEWIMNKDDKGRK
jgi:hypothetical protein